MEKKEKREMWELQKMGKLMKIWIGNIRNIGNLQWKQCSETIIIYRYFKETKLGLDNKALSRKEFQDGFGKIGKIEYMSKIKTMKTQSKIKTIKTQSIKLRPI